MSGFGVVRLIMMLSVRRARRGRGVWLALALLALALAAAGVTLATGYGGISFYKDTLELLLRYLTPFIMALLASHAVAEEVQGKTITYLFSRPIPRWALPVGKYLGSVCIATPLLCLALILVYVIGLLGYPDEIMAELPSLLKGLGAVCLGVVLFGAVATAFGTMIVGHPFVVNMIYLLVAEVGISLIPGWTKLASMTVHLRAVAGIYEPEKTFTVTDPALTAMISVPVLLAVTVVWLGLAVVWVVSSEYKTES